MSYRSQMEREEDAIHDAFDRGQITHAEMQSELRELQRDYQSLAREAAQDAYEDEMERW